MKNNVQILFSNSNLNSYKAQAKSVPSQKTFKEVYSQKKIEAPSPLPTLSIKNAQAPGVTALKNVLNTMVNNHEAALSSIKEAMQVNHQSPEKLLKIQFKTGAYFLREQMFCKTAELFTNSLKNFTQMQV